MSSPINLARSVDLYLESQNNCKEQNQTVSIIESRQPLVLIVVSSSSNYKDHDLDLENSFAEM